MNINVIQKEHIEQIINSMGLLENIKSNQQGSNDIGIVEKIKN